MALTQFTITKYYNTYLCEKQNISEHIRS